MLLRTRKYGRGGRGEDNKMPDRGTSLGKK